MLQRIAAACPGVSLDWLLLGDEPVFRGPRKSGEHITDAEFEDEVAARVLRFVQREVEHAGIIEGERYGKWACALDAFLAHAARQELDAVRAYRAWQLKVRAAERALAPVTPSADETWLAAYGAAAYDPVTRTVHPLDEATLPPDQAEALTRARDHACRSSEARTRLTAALASFDKPREPLLWPWRIEGNAAPPEPASTQDTMVLARTPGWLHQVRLDSGRRVARWATPAENARWDAPRPAQPTTP